MRGTNMADADLDVIIRQLAKQQHKSLTAAVKAQRDRAQGEVDRGAGRLPVLQVEPAGGS